MSRKVTVALPVYKRLNYLPSVLACLQNQDYENLDILISDNGVNGAALDDLLEQHLDRPYRVRRNPASVTICEHFNQLVEAAEGAYFVLLSDDDEISPEYVSELAGLLDSDPDIGVALSKLEVMDEVGVTRLDDRHTQPPPSVMSGDEFVRIWCTGEYNFVCFVTTMARTAEIRRVGAYPELTGGTSTDNALMVKLSFGRKVGFAPGATFRYRVYEASTGLALDPSQLASDLRAFLQFLGRRFRSRPRSRWPIRHNGPDHASQLVEMTWRTYRHRWKTMYRKRLGTTAWVRAAFEMPFVSAYYRSVAWTLLRAGLSATKRTLLYPVRSARGTP